MAWRLVKGALKKAREAADLSQFQLAGQSGVSLRTIKYFESDNPPKAVSFKVRVGIMRVLRHPPEPIFIPTADEPPLPATDSSYTLAASQTATDADEADALPATGTLARRAEGEHQLGFDDVKVKTNRGELPLLGLTWFKLIWSRPMKYEGLRFLVTGEVDEHEGLNRSLRKHFKLSDGGKYRVVRWLDDKTPFYTTVFAFASEHADTLTAAGRAKNVAAMIIRVVNAPPEGDWKGFIFFGKERQAFEFGFICEEILTEIPAVPGRLTKKTHVTGRVPGRPPADSLLSQLNLAPVAPKSSASTAKRRGRVA